MNEAEMTYRPAMNATREELRGVALDMKERADRTITQDAAMRFYARATFWATLALSAPEGDVKEPAPETDVPVTQPCIFAYEGRVWDLSKEYVDKDGDVWSFNGNMRTCGMPIMETTAITYPATLAQAISEYGPLRLWSVDETDTSKHTQCHTCGYMHVPTGQ